MANKTALNTDQGDMALRSLPASSVNSAKQDKRYPTRPGGFLQQTFLRLVRSSERYVWLTFDDGPCPVETPKILRTLDQFNARAVFFMVGSNVEAHPDVVQRISDAGHGLANHSYSNADLTELKPSEIVEEINRTADLLAPYRGALKLFRPPHGKCNRAVLTALGQTGHRLVANTSIADDRDPDQWPDRWILRSVQYVDNSPHAVLGMHDVEPHTSANLETLLARIRSLGPVTFMDPDTL